MLIYDSHCHLAALINDTRQLKIAVPAIELTDAQELLNYRRRNRLAKIGCGLHPWRVTPAIDTMQLGVNLRQQIKDNGPDFIGETGLDALRPNLEAQIQALIVHLELACEFKLPIVIHCVRAYNQLLNLLCAFPQVRGVIHAYNGNRQLAAQLHKKNFHLGIGSIILNPNSQLTKSAEHFNSAQIVMESDAPYMPGPDKEHSSSSDCIIYAQRLAELQKKSLTQLIGEANSNWNNLFNGA